MYSSKESTHMHFRKPHINWGRCDFQVNLCDENLRREEKREVSMEDRAY